MNLWTRVLIALGFEDEWGQVWCTLDQLLKAGEEENRE